MLTLPTSSINQSYKDMTSDVFDAEVNQLTTADPINKWAEEKTRGKITDVVDQINPDTNILIANAIYFKVHHSVVYLSLYALNLKFVLREPGARSFPKNLMKLDHSTPQKNKKRQLNSWSRTDSKCFTTKTITFRSLICRTNRTIGLHVSYCRRNLSQRTVSR